MEGTQNQTLFDIFKIIFNNNLSSIIQVVNNCITFILHIQYNLKMYHTLVCSPAAFILQNYHVNTVARQGKNLICAFGH